MINLHIFLEIYRNWDLISINQFGARTHLYSMNKIDTLIKYTINQS